VDAKAKRHRKIAGEQAAICRRLQEAVAVNPGGPVLGPHGTVTRTHSQARR